MVSKITRDFYIPREGQYASNVNEVQREGVEAICYVYDNSRGKPSMMCFGGKRSKPDSNYYYVSPEKRDEAVQEYLDRQEAIARDREERRAARNKADRGLKVGDVLYESWGYDQTNIDYYKVTELVGKKSVRIIPIASKLVSSEPPCDMVAPAPDVPREWDVLLELERGWENEYPNGVVRRARNGSVRLKDGYSASKCDPKEARYETSAGWGH